MKNTLLAASVLTVAAAAQAQSSVTLYGRVETGIEYMTGIQNPSGTGSESRFRVTPGDLALSMIGLKGSEDLGGGFKTQFRLEGEFNSNDGTLDSSGSLFNTWAEVGISHDTYGTILLGRQNFIPNNVWDFDPMGQSNWSSASLVRGRNWPYSSNNISYQSATWHGFDVYGQYSLSNATNWNGNGTTPQGRQDGIQLTYTSALFQVRGLYDEIRDKDGRLSDVYAASREYFGGVNIFLDPVKLQLVYQGSEAPDALPGAPTRTQQEWGGATWQINPAVAVIGAVYHVNANHGGGSATLYAIGGTYNLSKRTLIALEAASVRNSKNADFGLNANYPVTNSTDNPPPGHSQSGVFVDLQHSF
ncbi:porin [Burkholderia sp. LMG 21824]|uniref:porin n=1 Tax=Burkholderia sp. LMG 21824 TaxID=3158172 RepID=UPI003C2F9291